ncbi:fungal-specific transcription factor domain-containing protein [Mycena belliarum]|uniref:Fungal-specific transcription factor domain-containing protein n=1 Tax=Mycena belliarum TaxID=1033014 RepID=A0AAD6U9N0_9AGAR|nr:fungal-specific transcription factor domain-containing protein [Mycena belliae]
MPKSPQSPNNRKPGAPKAKGAVRAKSGCYTCRIRRKKCDERANLDGHCETCVRLRLQCLGFGAKRPEWLRESRNVADMRDKIKTFLAAQGMIKGHSGAGARLAEQDVLRLEGDSTPSSSGSPATPTLSLSPSEGHRQLHHESAVRDSQREQPAWIGDYGLPVMRDSSPFDGSSHSSHHDIHHEMYSTQYNSHSLVPSWTRPSPSESALSPSYHLVFDDVDDLFGLPLDDDAGFPLPYDLRMKPGDTLVSYYLGNVMDLQYLLADSAQIRGILEPSVNAPGASRDAARLLAAIHTQRATVRSDAYVALHDPDAQAQYAELRRVLAKPAASEDDALAAISIVSSVLFDGGAGPWGEWLQLSHAYAARVLRAPAGARAALLRCAPTTRFIVQAAIWFDVLAAVTTHAAPRFLAYIDALFAPGLPPVPEALSMRSVMGCADTTVWALAHVSALAAWQRGEARAGRLSVPALVAKAAVLEQHLAPPEGTAGAVVPAGAGAGAWDTETARALSAEVFRAATRLYLRATVSGAHPRVPEVRAAVAETLGAARALGRHPPRVHSSVVRSTVFAFFVAGALSDDAGVWGEVDAVLSLRGEDAAQATVGNSAGIRRLLQGIWGMERAPGAEVPWREVLRDANMLLV